MSECISKGQQKLLDTIADLAPQISQWSMDNFGFNEHRAMGTKWGSIAAFVGMVEESGEAYEATTPEEALDAHADALIYLCDLVGREFIRIEKVDEELWKEHFPDSENGSTLFKRSAAGRLARALLKRQQCIRGYESPAFAARQVQFWAAVLALQIGESIIMDQEEANEEFPEVACEVKSPSDVLRETWERIVAKRDWRANKSTGDAQLEA